MIAAAHFGSEFLLFRTVKINRASIWPLLIGSESESLRFSLVPYASDRTDKVGTSSIWMYLQKGYYLDQ
jgi:hypothetical protein